MAKNSVRDFDATAANNTDIQSVDIAENCAPSGINNAIRELMADIKDVSAGTVALESPQADSMTVTGDLTVDTDTLFVDASADAVGIGTSSPNSSSTLHVKDQTDIAMSNNADGQITIEGNGYSGAIALNATGMQIYQNSGARSLIFGNNETEQMRIDSVGSIGIIGATFGLISNGGQSATTLADDAFINLASHGVATAGGGLLCIYEPASGEHALYQVGYNWAQLVANSRGSLYAVNDTDGKNCIIYDQHTIRFKNRTGSSRGYVFNLFIAGGSNFNQ